MDDEKGVGVAYKDVCADFTCLLGHRREWSFEPALMIKGLWRPGLRLLAFASGLILTALNRLCAAIVTIRKEGRSATPCLLYLQRFFCEEYRRCRFERCCCIMLISVMWLFDVLCQAV